MKKKWCLKHQTLGRWVICSIDPATQHITLKIVGFLYTKIQIKWEVSNLCGLFSKSKLQNKDNFQWSGVWVNLLRTIIIRWVYHKLSVHMWSACWHHNSSLHSIHMSTNLLKHFFFRTSFEVAVMLSIIVQFTASNPLLHFKRYFKAWTFTYFFSDMTKFNIMAILSDKILILSIFCPI